MSDSLATVENECSMLASLGDRHGENILFDGLKGDTVHVDLNCLFDKVGGRVPVWKIHRLTSSGQDIRDPGACSLPLDS